MRSKLHSDQPIRDPGEDELDISQFVDRLLRPLLDWPPKESLVIGLYAPWGTGKTSVLNLLQTRLGQPDAKKRAVIARFNPWLYRDAETLLSAFFATLQEVTRTTPLLTPARKKSLDTALSSIRSVVTPFVAALATPHTGGVDLVTPVSSGVGQALGAALAGGEINFEAQKRKAAEALDHLGTRAASARLVVLIDDLDRADAREVRAMLKLVRLIADLPNVTYVLAMDYQRVRRVLGDGADEASGGSYLEKIIQIPLQLPPISPDRVGELLIAGLDAILEDAADGRLPAVRIAPQLAKRNVDIADMLLWRVRTLRDRARLLNSYRFLLLSSGQALEVDPVDALLVSFLSTFYPSIVERVRGEKEFLTQRENMHALLREMSMKPDEKKQQRAEEFAQIVGGESPAEERGLRTILLRLFPQAEIGEGPDDDRRRKWRRENRIAAPERFDRYFTYSAPESSASDYEVDEWIAKAVTPFVGATPVEGRRCSPTVARDLQRVLGGFTPAKQVDFIGKVLDRVEELDIRVAVPLGFAFAEASAAGLDEGEAANAIRSLLKVALLSRHQMEIRQIDDDAAPGNAGVAGEIENALHQAFAVLIRGVQDPFDAVAAAGEHVGTWKSRQDRDAQRGDGNDAELSPGLRDVLNAGLERMSRAVGEDRDVFASDEMRAGQTIWRWRDLLTYGGSSLEPIRIYIRGVLSAHPERLPAVLGLFALWSDHEPTLKMRDRTEIRQAADQVLGWRSLLRAYVGYRRGGFVSDRVHSRLVPQFEQLVRRHQGGRVQEQHPSEFR